MTALRRLIDWVLGQWLAWVLFSCVLMLAIAHGFETFGHLNPCILCLQQRAVYWVAGAIALGGLLTRWSARQAPGIQLAGSGLSAILVIVTAFLMQQTYLYWAVVDLAVVLAIAGFVAPWMRWRAHASALVFGALAVCFLTGMGVAVWHAGAEWKFWPGPAACAANRLGVSTADLAAALAGPVKKGPSCEEAAWRMFGISMAGYNVLISLKLAFWSAVAATGWRARR